VTRRRAERRGPTSPDEEVADDETIPDAVWEAALQGLKPGEYQTHLSPASVQYNTTVLRDYINRAPASQSAKDAALATMTKWMNRALSDTDGDSIYAHLVEATRAVTRLYPRGDLSLQVHHMHTVKGNPATFLKTRTQRARPKVLAMVKRIKDPQERARVAGNPEVIRLWIQQLIDADTTDRPQILGEVEMNVLTQQAHTGQGGVHSQPIDPTTDQGQ
jgi:hypothetical protein